MAPSATDNITLNEAVENFLQTEFINAIGEIRDQIIAPELAVQKFILTPFVKATVLIHEKWIEHQDIPIQLLFETPLVQALWILREKSDSNFGRISTLKDAADAFIYTDFLAAVDYLKDHIASPQKAVQRLLRTPFVKAMDFLHEKWMENRNIAIEKLFDTPLLKEILVLRAITTETDQTGKIEEDVDRLLQTEFITAVDYLRIHISAPENAVQILLKTPFLKAMETLYLEKDNFSGQNKVVVDNLFQTSVMKTIQNIREKVAKSTS